MEVVGKATHYPHQHLHHHCPVTCERDSLLRWGTFIRFRPVADKWRSVTGHNGCENNLRFIYYSYGLGTCQAGMVKEEQPQAGRQARETDMDRPTDGPTGRLLNDNIHWVGLDGDMIRCCPLIGCPGWSWCIDKFLRMCFVEKQRQQQQ